MAEKWKTFKHRVETVDGGWRATCATPKRAAQIVREHNSHEALIEALDDAKTAIYDAMHAGNLSRAYGNGAIGKIEAALALAEVK